MALVVYTSDDTECSIQQATFGLVNEQLRMCDWNSRKARKLKRIAFPCRSSSEFWVLSIWVIECGSIKPLFHGKHSSCIALSVHTKQTQQNPSSRVVVTTEMGIEAAPRINRNSSGKIRFNWSESQDFWWFCFGVPYPRRRQATETSRNLTLNKTLTLRSLSFPLGFRGISFGVPERREAAQI